MAAEESGVGLLVNFQNIEAAEESGVDLLVNLQNIEETSKSPEPPLPLPDKAEILKTFEAAVASEKARRVEPQEIGSPQLLDDDVKLITEEEFDFDLPLAMISPSHGKEEIDDDEEEVFFGPVGHTEKCVATVVGEQEVEPIPALTAADMVHIFKEAHEVAFRISAKFGDKKKDSKSEGVLVPSLALGPLASPPAKKHTRKGTFSLDSPEQSEAEPEPTGKPQNSPAKRKGTFTSESPAKVKPEPTGKPQNSPAKRKGTFTLESPAKVKPEPTGKPQNSLAKRKSTFTLESPVEVKPESTGKPQNSPAKRKGTFTLESPVEVEPLSFKRNIPARSSLPQRGANNNLRVPLSRTKRRSVSPCNLKMEPTVKSQRSIPNLKSIIPSSLRRHKPNNPKAGTTDNQRRSTSPTNHNGNGAKKSLIRPLKGLFRPSAGQSGVQKPSASAPAQPSSALNVPSTTPEPTRPTQSNLKGPHTKLELLATGTLQKLGLGTNRGKQPSGPMKALGQPSRLKAPSDGQPRIPLKATVSGVPQQGTPPRKQALSSIKRPNNKTPVKQDRKVQPKRLIPMGSGSCHLSTKITTMDSAHTQGERT